MDKYERYTVDDFLADDHFLHWVLQPTHDEDEFWRKYLDEHPDKRKDIEEARFICSVFQVKQKKLSLDETYDIWDGVLRLSRRSKASRLAGLLKYAAVFLLLFVSGAVAYYFYDQGTGQAHFDLVSDVKPVGSEAKIVLSDGSEISLEKKESQINYSSSGDQLIVNNDTIKQNQFSRTEAINKVIIPYGKKSIIQLSDGTMVWLNAGSQLVYPSAFIRDKREVVLIGEAYFDVVENPDKPFIVKTSGLAVTVLGTKFDVSAYPEDKFVETVLESGSVSLEVTGNKLFNRNKRVLLKPNQKGTLNREDGEMSLMAVDVSQYTSWKDGMLKVEREDLIRVLKKVERYYNVRIELRDPLAGGFLISGKLDLKNSPEETLNSIRLTVPIDWTRKSNGDFVIVRK
ncbi:MAG: FecR domain-containing protein [Prolixibacteraceae bacterium]